MSACAKETSNSSCGVLFNYPPEMQKTAAEQYEVLQNWPASICLKKEAPDNCQRLLEVKGDFIQLLTLVDDYGVTRDTIRVCKNK